MQFPDMGHATARMMDDFLSICTVQDCLTVFRCIINWQCQCLPASKHSWQLAWCCVRLGFPSHIPTSTTKMLCMLSLLSLLLHSNARPLLLLFNVFLLYVLGFSGARAHLSLSTDCCSFKGSKGTNTVSGMHCRYNGDCGQEDSCKWII